MVSTTDGIKSLRDAEESTSASVCMLLAYIHVINKCAGEAGWATACRLIPVLSSLNLANRGDSVGVAAL